MVDPLGVAVRVAGHASVQVPDEGFYLTGILCYVPPTHHVVNLGVGFVDTGVAARLGGLGHWCPHHGFVQLASAPWHFNPDPGDPSSHPW